MTVSTFDLVVIGDHLGGLAAAALSSARRKRVLLFENPGTANRPLEYLNSFCGNPEHNIRLRHFFHQLGLSPFSPLEDDLIHFLPLSPPLQVILPRHRVNIYRDRIARQWDLKRELGDVSAPLEALMGKEEELRRKLPPMRPSVKLNRRSPLRRGVHNLAGHFRLRRVLQQAEGKDFSGLVSSLGLPAGLKEVLLAQAWTVLRTSPGPMPWFSVLTAVRSVGEGFYQNVSGQSGLLRGLREVFLRNGGECRPVGELKAIIPSRAEKAGISVDGGARLEAARIVIDEPLKKAVKLLSPDVAQALRRKGLEQTRGERSYGVMRLGIRRECLPESMGRLLIVLPEEGGPVSALLLARHADGNAPEGKTIGLEALSFFPSETADDEGREAIMAILKTVMPFLEESIDGEALYRSGCFPVFTTAGGWRFREELLVDGKESALFPYRQLVFLRNENYIGTDLSSGILSGAKALSNR